RTYSGKQRRKRGAGTLGLQPLWTLLVATQLLSWLRRLRVLPAPPLLASPPPPLLLLVPVLTRGAGRTSRQRARSCATGLAPILCCRFQRSAWQIVAMESVLRDFTCDAARPVCQSRVAILCRDRNE